MLFCSDFRCLPVQLRIHFSEKFCVGMTQIDTRNNLTRDGSGNPWPSGYSTNGSYCGLAPYPRHLGYRIDQSSRGRQRVTPQPHRGSTPKGGPPCDGYLTSYNALASLYQPDRVSL